MAESSNGLASSTSAPARVDGDDDAETKRQ